MRIVVQVFAFIGVLLTLLLAAGVGYFVYTMHRDRSATEESLMYVLNWGDLGKHSMIESILNRCESPPNPIIGDHVAAYKLQIAAVPSEFWSSQSARDRWHRPPFSDQVLVEAVETASMFARSDNCTWFPESAELNSDRFLLSFPKITLYDLRAEAVQLTAYDTQTGLLYFADVAW